MITVRASDERGRSDLSWLSSRHSFTFGEYYDPLQLGFRSLRVINEDIVQPNAGFAPHGHRDMEIVSYVLEGELAHKDTLGNGASIRPGDVQVMSAGTGIEHSEFNASDRELVRFLQIWIRPAEQGTAPGYQQKTFPREERTGRLRLVGSGDGRDGSLVIRQDVAFYAGLLDAGEVTNLTVAPDRRVWVQVARGNLLVNGTRLQAGDGAAIKDETELQFEQDGGAAAGEAEFLVFDLA